MSLEKMGKTPQEGFWQTQEMTQLFICLKNSIIQKGEKIFNINFRLLTSFLGLFYFESNLDIRATGSLTNLETFQ